MAARDRRRTDSVQRVEPQFDFELLEPRRLLSADLGDAADEPVSYLCVDATAGVITSRDGHVGGELATFRGELDASEYTATIEWGEAAELTTGTISVNADGTYSVSAAYDYRGDGLHDVVVTVQGSDGEIAYAFMRSIPKADSITVTGVPSIYELLDPNQEQLLPSLGYFFDIDHMGSQDVSAYSITVDWGDGTVGSATAVPAWEGGFIIRGDHHYSTVGEFPVSVSISRNDDVSASATSSGYANVFDQFPQSGEPIFTTTVVGFTPLTEESLPTDQTGQAVLGQAVRAPSAAPFANESPVESLAAQIFKDDRTVSELDSGSADPIV